MDPRYSSHRFNEASEPERKQLLIDLADALRAALQSAADFHGTAYRLVADLRALGHDLYSFDESDEMQVWCPDWTKPSMHGLVVEFRSPSDVKVNWRNRSQYPIPETRQLTDVVIAQPEQGRGSNPAEPRRRDHRGVVPTRSITPRRRA